MGKFSIKFDKKLLKNLKDDPNSGVHLNTNKIHLAVHPFQLNEFNSSLKDILNQNIAKYDQNLNGILLGYQNIKLTSNVGHISQDTCFIHFDIIADFFTFKPQVGLALEGIATKKTKDHVGCLVYNTFNVSLPKKESLDNDWLGDNVQSGQKLKFVITFVDLDHRLPYIRGRLTEVMSENGEVRSGVEEVNVGSQNIKKARSGRKQESESSRMSLGGVLVRNSKKMADSDDVIENNVEFDSKMEKILGESSKKRKKVKNTNESVKKKKKIS